MPCAGPMCRSFEPNLAAVREALGVQLVYCSSDGSREVAAERAASLQAPRVEDPEPLKAQFRVWSGRERIAGQRRSGVPALVVLGPSDLEELAFLDAEARGVQALADWPDHGAWP